jgi:uncharacterized DUF497 family protein
MSERTPPELAPHGRLVKVTTIHMSLLTRSERWYAVGYDKDGEAEAAVRAYLGNEEKARVVAHRRLSESEIKNLQLKIEEVRKYL